MNKKNDQMYIIREFVFIWQNAEKSGIEWAGGGLLGPLPELLTDIVLAQLSRQKYLAGTSEPDTPPCVNTKCIQCLFGALFEAIAQCSAIAFVKGCNLKKWDLVITRGSFYSCETKHKKVRSSSC